MIQNKWLIAIAIFLFLIGGATLLLYFYNDSMVCVADPIAYKQANDNITCFCLDKIYANGREL